MSVVVWSFGWFGSGNASCHVSNISLPFVRDGFSDWKIRLRVVSGDGWDVNARFFHIAPRWSFGGCTLVYSTWPNDGMWLRAEQQKRVG